MSTTTQTHLMTADELAKIDDWSHRHALIKGELLTMPLPKSEHGRVAANLMMLLDAFSLKSDTTLKVTPTLY